MRVGVNPEKLKGQTLRHYRHRIIIPVYIPELDSAYYKHQLDVLNLCLDSLFASIDQEQSVITVIDNNCCRQVKEYLQNCLSKGVINKLVINRENRGKVEPLYNEVHASTEEFVTISDADILFGQNWEKAVFNLMSAFPDAGAITPAPMPQHCFHANSALVYSLSFLEYAPSVASEDLILYEKGIRNLRAFANDKLKYDWKERQLTIKRNNNSACLGASHFIASFRKKIFKGERLSPTENLFKSGDEYEYFDRAAERKGYLQLSTIKAHVYHLGNSLPAELNYIQGYLNNQIVLGQPFSILNKSDGCRVPILLQLMAAKLFKKFFYIYWKKKSSIKKSFSLNAIK
jgi:hypothetical protein